MMEMSSPDEGHDSYIFNPILLTQCRCYSPPTCDVTVHPFFIHIIVAGGGAPAFPIIHAVSGTCAVGLALKDEWEDTRWALSTGIWPWVLKQKRRQRIWGLLRSEADVIRQDTFSPGPDFIKEIEL